MDKKEQINTLVTVGTGLPPVNPYLDESSQTEDEEDSPSKKRKTGRTPASGPKSSGKSQIAPDPKEYIAELERPEEDNLY